MPASVPDVNNAFYLSMSLLAATLVYLVLILPESRQPTLDDRRVPSESHVQFKVSPILVLRRHLHRFASALIIPITIFAPRQIPSQPHRKNYNLTLVGAAIFVYVASNVRALSFRCSYIFKSSPLERWLDQIPICPACVRLDNYAGTDIWFLLCFLLF